MCATNVFQGFFCSQPISAPKKALGTAPAVHCPDFTKVLTEAQSHSKSSEEWVPGCWWDSSGFQAEMAVFPLPTALGKIKARPIRTSCFSRALVDQRWKEVKEALPFSVQIQQKEQRKAETWRKSSVLLTNSSIREKAIGCTPFPSHYLSGGLSRSAVSLVLGAFLALYLQGWQCGIKAEGQDWMIWKNS